MIGKIKTIVKKVRIKSVTKFKPKFSLNRDTVKLREGCFSCKDSKGNNKGNMYICPSCGRHVH